MDKVEILIVGTNEPIMKTIARLIDHEGKWVSTIALTVDEAFEISSKKEFGLVLICGGLSSEEELILYKNLKELYPNLPITMHYGGGSGLLFAEIYESLKNHNIKNLLLNI